ncbi:MAG: histidine kinase [Candidatus Dormibacteraeota bacterium]|nr:histidine kinase [Candidatus Dormibacteraeota bacterium]
MERAGIIPPADASHDTARYSPLVRQLGTLARRFDIRQLDVVLALGLTAWAWGEGLNTGNLTPAVLLCTLPLLVRRRWPIAVFVVGIAGIALGGNRVGLAALLGVLIAAVSLGIYTPHRLVASFLVVFSAAGIAIEYTSGRSGSSTLPIPNEVLPLALLGAAYLAGNEIASRQRQADQQRERAHQLEQERAEAVAAAAETERRHIARELHDVVAHSVGVMVVQAGAARKVMDDKPDAARESLLAVEASGHEAMGELRRLLGVLSETSSEAPPLAPQPGMAGLDALIARVKEAGLPVEFRVEGPPESLPPGVDVAGYRIVQEALTNALKYAGGAPTEVVVRYTPDGVEIEVIDEGAIATPADGIGRGLVGMQERVALFGGTVVAGKRPEGGYAVRAYLPLDAR